MTAAHDPRRVSRQRLFFALWPDARCRERVASLSRKALKGKGRLVAASNLHLTLCFLGSLDAGRRASAEDAVGAIQCTAFLLRLQRLGHWPRPRVAWSAPLSVPAPLLALVGALRDALAHRGLPVERRPYQAHVTLARKVAGPITVQCHEPVDWHVERFCLVESVTHSAGVEYRPLRFWTLGTRGAACGLTPVARG